MFTSLSIKRFRGIVNGEIDCFTPVTVLMGANNSGKSTCVEALTLISMGGHGIARVVRRRGWFGKESVLRVFGSEHANTELAANSAISKERAPQATFRAWRLLE